MACSAVPAPSEMKLSGKLQTWPGLEPKTQHCWANRQGLARTGSAMLAIKIGFYTFLVLQDCIFASAANCVSHWQLWASSCSFWRETSWTSVLAQRGHTTLQGPQTWCCVVLLLANRLASTFPPKAVWRHKVMHSLCSWQLSLSVVAQQYHMSPSWGPTSWHRAMWPLQNCCLPFRLVRNQCIALAAIAAGNASRLRQPVRQAICFVKANIVQQQSHWYLSDSRSCEAGARTGTTALSHLSSWWNAIGKVSLQKFSPHCSKSLNAKSGCLLSENS